MEPVLRGSGRAAPEQHQQAGRMEGRHPGRRRLGGRRRLRAAGRLLRARRPPTARRAARLTRPPARATDAGPAAGASTRPAAPPPGLRGRRSRRRSRPGPRRRARRPQRRTQPSCMEPRPPRGRWLPRPPARRGRRAFGQQTATGTEARPPRLAASPTAEVHRQQCLLPLSLAPGTATRVRTNPIRSDRTSAARLGYTTGPYRGCTADQGRNRVRAVNGGKTHKGP